MRVQGTRLLNPPGPTIGFDEPIHPPLPIDDSDGGSDTGETVPSRPWTRQHEAIEIDHGKDGISDNGIEIYSFLINNSRDRAYIIGVHANMCIIKRQFGIRQMQARGIKMALVGDLTDTMYNPAKPPYVSHEEGTRLVLEYIKKYWCPVVESQKVLPQLDSITISERQRIINPQFYL